MVVKGLKELANELGLAMSTVYKLQKKGVLKPVKKDSGISGAWHFDVDQSKKAYADHVNKVITNKWRNIY